MKTFYEVCRNVGRSNVCSTVINAMISSAIEDGAVRAFSGNNGGQSLESEIRRGLIALGYDAVTMNDAPRGGRHGDYVVITRCGDKTPERAKYIRTWRHHNALRISNERYETDYMRRAEALALSFDGSRFTDDYTQVKSGNEALKMGFKNLIAWHDHYCGNSKGYVHTESLEKYGITHYIMHDRGCHTLIATNNDVVALVELRRKAISLKEHAGLYRKVTIDTRQVIDHIILATKHVSSTMSIQ